MPDDPSDSDQRGKPRVVPITPDAPLPAPLNDNLETDSDRFGRMWGYFAMRRLDVIEARVAKLEKRGQLQLIGGVNFEAERALIRHELAFTHMQVAAFLGLPLPDDLPDDWGMR